MLRARSTPPSNGRCTDGATGEAIELPLVQHEPSRSPDSVDSNLLLDVFTEDPAWLDWSSRSLSAAAESGPLFVNPIVYAEVSVRFSRVEDLEDALPASADHAAALRPPPWDASAP